MTTAEILILSAALATDAFSVSVSGGMNSRFGIRRGAAMALMFGLFQFIMPVIGNGAALFFTEYTQNIAPYIVFAVLAFLGMKMIIDSRQDSTLPADPFKPASLLLLSFATSVDALAAGVSIGASGTPILYASAVIGIIAALFSAAGLCIGRAAKHILPVRAEIIGGAVLILLAVKSLLEAIL